MISLSEEKRKWHQEFARLDAATIDHVINLGHFWLQIKTLEQSEICVLGGGVSNPDFDSRMRGVAEFLFDLNKNIGQ